MCVCCNAQVSAQCEQSSGVDRRGAEENKCDLKGATRQNCCALSPTKFTRVLRILLPRIRIRALYQITTRNCTCHRGKQKAKEIHWLKETAKFVLAEITSKTQKRWQLPHSQRRSTATHTHSCTWPRSAWVIGTCLCVVLTQRMAVCTRWREMEMDKCEWARASSLRMRMRRYTLRL